MYRQLIIFLLLIIFQQNSFAQNWSFSELGMMPERVSNNAVAEGFVNEKAFVYSFGGIDSTKSPQGIHLNSFRYDVENDSWTTLPPLPDTLGKIAAAASRIGDIIYIIGGYHVFANEDEASSNRVHRFDIAANQFLTNGANIPVAIDDQVQVVWRDSLIYVITGWSDGENVSNVQIYNPLTDTWQQGTPLPANESYRSFGSSGTIIGDTIYYFGGARFGSNFPAQANFRKGVIDPDDPLSISWNVSIPNGNRKGYRMASTSIGKKAFWIGGADQTYNFDGLAYSTGNGVPPTYRILELDSRTNLWTETPLPGLPMDLRGIAKIADDKMIIAGGMLENQMVSNRTFLLSFQGSTVSSQTLENQKIVVDIYPNPANQWIRLKLSITHDKPLVFKLFNVYGRKVIQQNLAMGLQTAQFATSHLPEGIYFAGIFLDGKLLHRQKIIILH